MIPRKFTDELLRNAINIFDASSGSVTIKEVALQLGVTRCNLSKALRAIGYVIPKCRKPAHNRKNVPVDEIVAKYISGDSELSISKEFKIARGTVRKCLIDSGTEIRNGSEANFIRMSRLSIEDRKNLTRSANDAVRGIPEPRCRKIKRAINAENGICEVIVGKGEYEFREALTSLGIEFVWQKSAEVYSIDFAINGIAVELKSGKSGNTGIKADIARNRVKNLANLGWRTLYVTFDSVESLVAGVKDIIANVNILNSNPSPISQYRVIHCRFNTFSRFRDDKGRFHCVSTPPELVTTVRDFNI
jgi:hypothetical protein